MSILQSFYAGLLSPFQKMNKKIPWSLRRLVILACSFAIMTFPLATRIDERIRVQLEFLDTLHGYGSRRRVFVITVLLTVIIAVSVEELKKVEWNRYFFSAWITCGLLIILAGTFHNIGYAYISMMFTIIVVYPCLYYVWACRGDIEKLYDTIALAILAENIIYFAGCLILAPMLISQTRYYGLNDNPNSYAITMTCFVIASLYLVMRADGVLRIIPAISLGCALMLLLMSVSRTSLLAGAAVIFIWLIIWIRQSFTLKAFLLVLLVGIMSSVSTYFMLCGGQDIMHLSPISALETEAVYADDRASEDEDFQDEVLPEDSDVAQRFDLSGGLNKISTGRIGIWQGYMREFNLIGNDITYTLPLKVIYYTGSVKQYSSPHNTTIEVAFRAGIPAAVLYIFIQLVGIVYVLSVAFGKKRKFRQYELFCTMAITGFIVIGMFESMFKPFRTDLLLLVLFSSLPLLSFGVREDNNK